MPARIILVITLLICIKSAYQRALSSAQPEDLTFFIPPVPIVSADQLQDVLDRAQSIREKAKEQPGAVSAAVAAAVGTLPPIQYSQALRVLKMLPREVHMHLPDAVELLAMIRALGTLAECRERNGGQGPPNTPSILIAADLTSCEEIMPYWILEVLRLALLLQEDPVLQAIHTSSILQGGAAANLRIDLAAPRTTRIAVSVYESGSIDRTPIWLQIAEALWSAAGIPNTVVVNGTLTRQEAMMDPAMGMIFKQHRVQHLANVRNKAMEPLYKNPSSYQYVLFINDVFFCATEIVRLSYLQADIACGLDLEVWIGGDVPKIRDAGQQNRGRALRRRLLSTDASAAAAGSVRRGDMRVIWQRAEERMTKLHADEAARQVETNKRIQAASIKPRYEFYDMWVARDIGGRPFIKHDPLARDLRTLEDLHNGLPFPVKCCWNGAVLFNASHFSNGLRFRAAMHKYGECDASECSIFCEDYRRLGSGRVAVDPSVRLSYTPWTEDFHGPLPGGIPSKVPWPAVKRSGVLERLQSVWQQTASDMFVDCLPLRKGFDGADMDRVHRVDIRRSNFTALFLRGLQAQEQPPRRGCNLIMGGYGAIADGEFFDDLMYASWGRNPITRLVHSSSEYVDSLQVVYGTTPARLHGIDSGDIDEHIVEAGEFINSAEVYYDETAVHGLELGTSVGRRIAIGNLHSSVKRARATPCPSDSAHAGRYRLIAFAGTADRYLRSVTLLWS